MTRDSSGNLDSIELDANDLRLIDDEGNIIPFTPTESEVSMRTLVQEFPEANTLISLARASQGIENNSHPDRCNPSNYFLGSFSGNAAFYAITESSLTSNSFAST